MARQFQSIPIPYEIIRLRVEREDVKPELYSSILGQHFGRVPDSTKVQDALTHALTLHSSTLLFHLCLDTITLCSNFTAEKPRVEYPSVYAEEGYWNDLGVSRHNRNYNRKGAMLHGAYVHNLEMGQLRQLLREPSLETLTFNCTGNWKMF